MREIRLAQPFRAGHCVRVLLAKHAATAPAACARAHSLLQISQARAQPLKIRLGALLPTGACATAPLVEETPPLHLTVACLPHVVPLYYYGTLEPVTCTKRYSIKAGAFLGTHCHKLSGLQVTCRRHHGSASCYCRRMVIWLVHCRSISSWKRTAATPPLLRRTVVAFCNGVIHVVLCPRAGSSRT